MKWYKHDTDAHRDTKLKKLRIKYGMKGYGLYWYCLELIAGNIDKDNITFELEDDAEIIAHETGINVDVVNEMMAYMVNLDLFQQSEGRIICMKLSKRLDQSMTSNPEMRHIIDKIKNNHDSVMTKSQKVMQDKTRLDKNKDSTSSPKVNDPPPYQKIIDLYHEKLPTLPRVEKLTNTRRGYIRQRWIEDLPALKNWENYFDYVSESDFLMGRTQPSNGRPPFRANLEWLTKPANYAKVAEEHYHGV